MIQMARGGGEGTRRSDGVDSGELLRNVVGCWCLWWFSGGSSSRGRLLFDWGVACGRENGREEGRGGRKGGTGKKGSLLRWRTRVWGMTVAVRFLDLRL